MLREIPVFALRQGVENGAPETGVSGPGTGIWGDAGPQERNPAGACGRSLPAGSPGTATVRALTQSAFVDEDDGLAPAAGFFFNSGQRTFFLC